MRAADLVTATVLIAIGFLVIADAVRLGLGWGTDGPRSGFFPFWLAVLMIGACLGIAIRALRRKDARPFITRQALRPVLTMLVPAAAAVALMQVGGLYVASALYLAFYMRWVGRHTWAAVLAVGLGFPLLTFVVFERWFLVPMPKGPLEYWLGL
jgi:putative tricarboxylic transport membrane protein